jgi:hypothetical protein
MYSFPGLLDLYLTVRDQHPIFRPLKIKTRYELTDRVTLRPVHRLSSLLVLLRCDIKETTRGKVATLHVSCFPTGHWIYDSSYMNSVARTPVLNHKFECRLLCSGPAASRSTGA